MADTAAPWSGRLLSSDGTSFVGRAPLLAAGAKALRGARLLTMIGPGGVGKTRAGIELARSVAADYPDGVYWIDLTTVPAAAPELLAGEILLCVGVREQSSRDRIAVLVEHLGSARSLVVLDNAEHLVEPVARLVGVLLRWTERMRFVVTSRQLLHLRQEHVLPVPPLSLPGSAEAGEAMAYEAPQLLLDRASTAGVLLTEQHHGDIIRLCQALDGIPLAIELAASRLSTLALPEILNQVRRDDGRPNARFALLRNNDPTAAPQHRTLQAMVDWSYRSCTPAAQLLLARLSVFAGSFDLGAVRAVCAEDPADIEVESAGVSRDAVLDVLGELVDRSLVLADTSGVTAWYRMLETFRQFGLAHLRAIDGAEQRTRDAHRDYFAALVERAAAQWYGPEEVRWLRRLLVQGPDLRVAVEHTLRGPDRTRAAWLIIHWTSTRSLFLSGQLDDIRLQFRRAFGLTERPEVGYGVRDLPATIELLNALAIGVWISASGGDHQRARDLLRELEAVALRHGAVETLPPQDMARGAVALLIDADPASITLFQQARDGFEKFGPPAAGSKHMAWLFCALGSALIGTEAQAREESAACLRDALAHGAEWASSWARLTVALGELLHGDPLLARPMLREVLSWQWGIGDHWGSTWAMMGTAWCAVELALAEPDPRRSRARLIEAARMLGAAAAVRRLIGVDIRNLVPMHNINDAVSRRGRQALGATAFQAGFDAGVGLSYAAAVELALGEPTTQPAASASLRGLTEAELAVVALVARGLNNAQIARHRQRSLRTVESQISNALRKTGAQSRAGLVALYFTETRAELNTVD